MTASIDMVNVDPCGGRSPCRVAEEKIRERVIEQESVVNECNKRRRMDDHCFRSFNIQLSDLPESILSSIADFLPKTSVALFAVAFSVSKSVWYHQSQASQGSAARDHGSGDYVGSKVPVR